jgi:hypothetical protein
VKCIICKNKILPDLKRRYIIEVHGGWPMLAHLDCYRRGKAGKLVQMLLASGSLQKV